MGKIKNILKWGLILYTSLYLALTGHIAYDYITKHREWLRNNVKNELVVKDFSVNLEDKVREVTFVGETYAYNEKESEFSKDFIKQFQLVLYEGIESENKNIKWLDKAYLISLVIPGLISLSLEYNPNILAKMRISP